MASINYDDVFNQFLGEVTDHKLMSLCDSDAYELMVGRLHKALSNPLIKKTYSLLTFDDAIQEITYELKVSDGDASDKLFTIEILGNEMAYIWANTQVMSDVNTKQFYGSKEQKLREFLLSRFAVFGNIAVYFHEYAGTPLEP